VRPLILALLCAAAVHGQELSYGLRIGRAFTDPTRVQLGPSLSYAPTSGASIIGGAVELRVRQFGVAFEVLRRPLDYDLSGPNVDLRTEGSLWEFPLMARYRFRSGYVTPYVGAGVAWNRVSATERGEILQTSPAGPATTQRVSRTPADLRERSVAGTPIAAGLEGTMVFVYFSAELRYTRWHGDNFANAIGPLSRRNQVELLFGIMF
jgi:opacity protein-like surface antigen